MKRLLIVGLLALSSVGCTPKDACDPERLEAGLDRWEAHLAERHPSRLFRVESDVQMAEDAVLGACTGTPEFFSFLLKFNTAYRRQEVQRLSDWDLPVRTEKILAQMQALARRHCGVRSLADHVATLPPSERGAEVQRICDLPAPFWGQYATFYLALRERGIGEQLAMRTVVSVLEVPPSLPLLDPRFRARLPQRSACGGLPHALVVQMTKESVTVPTRATLRSFDDGTFFQIERWLRADATLEPDVRHLIVAADADVEGYNVDALRRAAPEGYETIVMVSEPSSRGFGFVPWPAGINRGTVAEVVATAPLDCGFM